MKNFFCVLLGIILLLSLTSCQTSTSFSKGLTVEETLLAKLNGDTWERANDDKFQKGDTIALFFLNVSGFKKDSEGLNWIDIDVEVKGPNGSIILDEKGLLGNSGHIALVDNIAESPYGSFNTDSTIDSGRYVIKVTIHDKIGKGKTVASKSFVIE